MTAQPVVTDTRTCEHCGTAFARRSDARFCCDRCRHAHWRARRLHWALITWSPRGQHHAAWTYHPTRSAALWLAPTDQPFTVIDTNVEVRPHPSVAELLWTRYVPGKDPYPNSRPRRGDARPSSINPLS
ncbi:MAG TPA: hypothetical protein VMU34_08005 [Mycobacterium sp.]|nr:hypothetical protein [Mycobacterium sp.]